MFLLLILLLFRRVASHPCKTLLELLPKAIPGTTNALIDMPVIIYKKSSNNLKVPVNYRVRLTN